MPNASRLLLLAVGEAGANIQRKSESEAASLRFEIYCEVPIGDWANTNKFNENDNENENRENGLVVSG